MTLRQLISNLFTPVMLFGALTGCIKDEDPNIEVDIIEVTSRSEGILNVVHHPGTSGEIDVYVDPARIEPANFNLEFMLSDGASIVPDPSGVSDYSTPRSFTVTSENREWSKNYTIKVMFNELPLAYDFEHWVNPDNVKYMIPVAKDASGGELYVWACGNDAYNFLAGHNDDHTIFPTQPTTEAHSGQYAVKLVTRTTPELSKPIASGNLFIGQFDASKRNPLESTQFGLPFIRKPLRLKGYYKYRSGGLTIKSNQPDLCRIQAVFYRTDDTLNHLNGITLHTSQNVVARAEMSSSDTQGEDYVPFDIELIYNSEIDEGLLAKGAYNLALIFSSSSKGDEYDGAVGSMLQIDDVEVICQQIQ